MHLLGSIVGAFLVCFAFSANAMITKEEEKKVTLTIKSQALTPEDKLEEIIIPFTEYWQNYYNGAWVEEGDPNSGYFSHWKKKKDGTYFDILGGLTENYVYAKDEKNKCEAIYDKEYGWYLAFPSNNDYFVDHDCHRALILIGKEYLRRDILIYNEGNLKPNDSYKFFNLLHQVVYKLSSPISTDKFPEIVEPLGKFFNMTFEEQKYQSFSFNVHNLFSSYTFLKQSGLKLNLKNVLEATKVLYEIKRNWDKHKFINMESFYNFYEWSEETDLSNTPFADWKDCLDKLYGGLEIVSDKPESRYCITCEDESFDNLEKKIQKTLTEIYSHTVIFKNEKTKFDNFCNKMLDD